jgi:hypothetical protein
MWAIPSSEGSELMNSAANYSAQGSPRVLRRADQNGTVKEGTAATEAWKLLRIPQIQQAIADAKKQQLAKAELNALQVLEELRRLAFLDPAEFFDAKGRLKRNIHDIPVEARAAIKHKVKCVSKEKALELLARHFRLATEVVEHKDQIDWDKRVARINPSFQLAFPEEA